MYADIGPSSFNQKRHQQLHIPAIDDAPIEYAQIKHESQHNERPSLEKQPTKPTGVLMIIESHLFVQMIRRDELNSQFIVTKFSILHAGGRSLFRFQTIRETRMAICLSSRSPEPRPLIRAL